MEEKGKGREDSSFQCDWFHPYGFASVTAGIPPNVYGISITSFLLYTVLFFVKGFKFRYSIEVCAPDVSIQHVVKFLQPGFRVLTRKSQQREREIDLRIAQKSLTLAAFPQWSTCWSTCVPGALTVIAPEVFVRSSQPNWMSPWQQRPQRSGTGSGFCINTSRRQAGRG